MEVIFFIIIIYAVLFGLVARVIRNVKMNSQDARKPMATSVANASNVPTSVSVTPKTTKTNANPSFKKGSVNKNLVHDKGYSALRDDRSNDWLARQIAEERLLNRRMAEMFSMRGTHSSSCEAEMIKRFHEDHCDSKELREEHRKNCDAEAIDSPLLTK